MSNLRDFVLVGPDGRGGATKLESLRLANSASDFWSRIEKPRAFARRVGASLGEYLARCAAHRAVLAEPKDLAKLLASHARDGLARVEAAGNVPSLRVIREALEQALGIRFEGVWERHTKLPREKRPRYPPHVFKGNKFFVTQQKPRREWSPPQVTSQIVCIDLMDRSATCIPIWLRDEGLGAVTGNERLDNLSRTAQQYLERLGSSVEDLFHHVLATLHDPEYREANAGAPRTEWPCIPLPGWPDENVEGAEEARARSAAHGRELAALLDSETRVPGVTRAPRRPEIVAIAVPSTVGGQDMEGDDFAVTVGWGHFGAGKAVMPGHGRLVKRTHLRTEGAALADTVGTFGEATFDVYLNDEAFWRNVPASVWDYRLGGYQVLKKWLSYRSKKVLGRGLGIDEVLHFTQTARRIGALLLATASRLP